MNKVTAIVAVDLDGYIGDGDKLLFKDKVDQAFFVGYTMGKACVVGYNTYNTLPKLTGRELILDTRTTLDLKFASFKSQVNEVVVIGGAKTYTKYAPQIEEVLITIFNESVGGDKRVDLNLFNHLKTRTTVFKTERFTIEEWST